MGIQGASQHSFTFDADTRLQDATAVTATAAGEIATVAQELDFGAVDSNGVTNIAFMEGHMIIDVSAFDFTTGDEFVQVIFQLGSVSGFASGTVANKAVIPIGVAGGLVNSAADNDSALGRRVIHVDNEFLGTPLRFARAFLVAGGTSPSITAEVWLSRIR